MNPYKKLLKNTLIFSLGNFGSKVLSIILVPYYTYILSASEYGTIDVIMTLISLILPIVSLSIFEGTLRYSLKSNYSPSNVLTTSLLVTLFGNLFFLLLFPLFKSISIINDYLIIFYFIIFLQSITSIFSQFARGTNKIKIYSINGVIVTLTTLILNIFFLSFYQLGIKGYLLSTLSAQFISLLYLAGSLRLVKFIDIKYVNISLLKEMIRYSLPLIPNSMMWWIINVSDRFLIILFLGTSANGLYAIANKIPTILSLVNSIFFQAWQISAIEEGDSSNKDKIYTSVFNTFSSIMIMSTSLLITFMKQLIDIFISNEFSDCWKYAPFLIIAAVFSSFSGFLGSIYTANKNTKGVLRTSIIGAIMNTVFNIVCIPVLGINGASLSTLISFLIVWLLRIRETKYFVRIKIQILKIISSFLIVFIQILNLFLFVEYSYIINFILFVFLLLIHREFFITILSKFYKKCK